MFEYKTDAIVLSYYNDGDCTERKTNFPSFDSLFSYLLTDEVDYYSEQLLLRNQILWLLDNNITFTIKYEDEIVDGMNDGLLTVLINIKIPSSKDAILFKLRWCGTS